MTFKIRIRHYLRGVGSILELAPLSSPSRLVDYHYQPSVEESLRDYWQDVGDHLRAAAEMASDDDHH